MATLEAIELLLAYVASLKVKLYQMNVTYEFLNVYLNKEVYVRQPSDFDDLENPNYVYEKHKAPYKLKQAPTAWYERYTKFTLDYDFKEVRLTKTFFLTIENFFLKSTYVIIM